MCVVVYCSQTSAAVHATVATTDLDCLVDTDMWQERLLHPSQHVDEEHQNLVMNTRWILQSERERGRGGKTNYMTGSSGGRQEGEREERKEEVEEREREGRRGVKDSRNYVTGSQVPQVQCDSVK